MYQHNNCPMCGHVINVEDRIGNSVICSGCGWTQSSTDDKSRKQIKKSFARMILLIAGVTLSLFMHSVKWGGYAVEIIPLKVKQWSQTASAEDFQRIAHICEERKNDSCAEAAYEDFAQDEPGNTEALAKWAAALEKRGSQKNAIKVYSIYFQRGGKGSAEALALANLLSTAQQNGVASQFYQQALASANEHQRVPAAQAYVAHLMKSGDMRTAEVFIQDFRRKNDRHAAYFMENQLQQIRRSLASR